MIIVANSDLARVGPTTPTRAGRLADASVDPTEARCAIVKGRAGRSRRADDGAQAQVDVRRLVRPLTRPVDWIIELDECATDPLDTAHERRRGLARAERFDGIRNDLQPFAEG